MKQGLTAHKADSLLENVGRQVSDVSRDVELVQRVAAQLGQLPRPRLLDVLALHAAIARTQVSHTDIHPSADCVVATWPFPAGQ